MWYEKLFTSVACKAKDAKDPVSQLTSIRKSFHGSFKSKYYFTEPTFLIHFRISFDVLFSSDEDGEHVACFL